jgi:phosphatidylglycerophosphatase A
LPQNPNFVPTKFSSIQVAIGTIFNFVIIVAGVIFIILILVGGIQYLTAAGNEEGTTKAKKLIVDGIVGLVITLAAWAIGTFILQFLGFQGVPGGGAGGIVPPTTPPFTGGGVP